MNNNFIKKVGKIRRDFKPTANDPISYLEKLIRKPDSKFILSKITIKDTTTSNLQMHQD